MGILIALALICALSFGASVIARTIVGVVGGTPPDWAFSRRLAQVGQAKFAVAGIDREYRELFPA